MQLNVYSLLFKNADEKEFCGIDATQSQMVEKLAGRVEELFL